MCIVSEMVACVGAKVRGLEFKSRIHIFSLTCMYYRLFQSVLNKIFSFDLLTVVITEINAGFHRKTFRLFQSVLKKILSFDLLVTVL